MYQICGVNKIYLIHLVNGKNAFVEYIAYPPPQTQTTKPCENFLKNQKFPGKIIFTGQKRG